MNKNNALQHWYTLGDLEIVKLLVEEISSHIRPFCVMLPRG